VYGDWLKKHSGDHICILQTSKHLSKAGAILQEQGFIKWVGRKIVGEGTLMNVSSFGNLPNEIPLEVEQRRVDKIKESLKDKSRYTEERAERISETRKSKWKNKHLEVGKVVQSLWLRTIGVNNPVGRYVGSKNKGWGHKTLELFIGPFPGSILKRIVDGEDYGGSPDQINDVEFFNFVEYLYDVHLDIRRKASEACTGKKIRITSVECPYCMSVGRAGNMKRYHFDNCKAKGKTS
jgi:hypothetical protein